MWRPFAFRTWIRWVRKIRYKHSKKNYNIKICFWTWWRKQTPPKFGSHWPIESKKPWIFKQAQLCRFLIVDRSRDSSVDIATRLRAGRPRNRGSIPGKGKRFTSSPKHPDRLWGPATILVKRYQGLFLRGQSGRWVKLTIHPHLVPRVRMCGTMLPPHTLSWWEHR